MAIRTKSQLAADIAGLPNPITAVALKALLVNMVDSLEGLINEYTTTQRDALTPYYGQKIFNTTSARVEMYTDDWFPIGQVGGNALNCSANPDYPAGLIGDMYVVTNAGKIGGGSGKTVNAGAIVTCIGGNAGGNEAAVGASWKVTTSA